MNIRQVNPVNKKVSAKIVFKTENSNVTVIQILEGELLKEHITKTPALLVCIFGQILFENEEGENCRLKQGDYLKIKPLIKHWVKSIENSQLLLIK